STLGDTTAVIDMMQKQHPDDPWTLYASAFMADRSMATYDQYEPYIARMMERAKEPSDRMIALRAASLRNRNQYAEALALVEGKQTPAMLSTKASILLAQAWANKDDKLAEQALDLYAQARKLDPHFMEAWMRASQQLRSKRRNEEAHALMKEAAALTPALMVHREYWTTVRADKSVPEEKKREEIDADIATILKTRGDWIPVLAQVATEYGAQKRTEEAERLRERILKEAPDSRFAEAALYARYSEFRREAGDKLTKDPETKAKNLKLIREFIAWPSHPNKQTLAMVNQSYFSAAENDPSIVTNEELQKIVHAMEPMGEDMPTIVYGRGAMALATRGFALDDAEAFARTGVAKLDKFIANNRLEMGTEVSSADMDKFEVTMRASMRDALGWVLLKRGRTDEALTQLFAAYEYNPDDMQVLYHLGQFNESRAQLAKAEDFYRRGAMLQSSTENPNRAAIKDLYAKRNGSLAGYDDYLHTLNDRDAAQRRKKVLSARNKSPRGVPPFALQTLDGKAVKLADLKGKVAVINFWGIWCSWCVKELPDYQRLARKYANDPQVVILTINNDNDDGRVKRWMAEKKYDFRVLVDDGYVSKNDIHAFPTTWFLDPAGRIAFEKKGWTEKLEQEFAWRVEALRLGGGRVNPPTPQ
ncbi:MAG TPA: redoxin domain-containing protein, partial [Thermoanaerobaculia bacterium]|nr:redoxin domain-containing protein [Thermoanaerobaculia bacterium]